MELFHIPFDKELLPLPRYLQISHQKFYLMIDKYIYENILAQASGARYA
jgi:hypothetical protein